MTASDIRPQRREPTSSVINVGDSERVLSVLGGGALMLAGLGGKNALGKLLLPLVGGMLVYRGLSGRCHAYASLGIDTAAKAGSQTSVEAGHGVKVDESITILRPPSDLYAFWRKFDQLPRIMRHLEGVEVLDARRSHWVARGPLGVSIEWDAEIINDKPNELIAWRSMPGSSVDTAGSVHFRPAPMGRGTEVRVTLKYDPPGGKAGAWLAWLSGNDPQGQIREGLRSLQSLLEAGERPTAQSQPAGRA